jgi:hypothetical protein
MFKPKKTQIPTETQSEALVRHPSGIAYSKQIEVPESTAAASEKPTDQPEPELQVGTGSSVCGI